MPTFQPRLNFSEFLRTYRIHLAIEKMLKDDASLKEIAQPVGFNYMATLARQFKKQLPLKQSIDR